MNGLYTLAKHLQGQHDQKRHAGRGSSLAKLQEETMFSDDTRPANLSKRSGIPPGEVNRVNGVFSMGANNFGTSLSLQTATAKALNSPLSSFQKKRLREFKPKDPETAKIAGGGMDKAKKLATAIYGETQNKLNELGMKTVKLYRGFTTDSRTYDGKKKGDPIEIGNSNAINSWSLDKDVAGEFTAGYYGPEGRIPQRHGIVLEMEVPANLIFSIGGVTGPGASTMSEILTLNLNGMEATITDKRR